jgi:hypothetical protein
VAFTSLLSLSNAASAALSDIYDSQARRWYANNRVSLFTN